MSWFKRKQWRSKAYLAFIEGRSCMHCFAPPPSEYHHWHPTEKGQALKPDDCFTVPLCHQCHIEGFHRNGTLPGLDPETTRTDFVREQWRCMAEYLRRLE